MKKYILFLGLLISLSVQAAEQITIAQFLAYADTETTYRLRGEVQNIVSTTYGNFTLVDETGSIYIYGLLNAEGQSKQFASMGIVEGDTVTLEGVYVLYNNTKPEIVSAQYISHVHPGQTPDVPSSGSLRICAQNLENYYYNYTQSSRPSYSTEAGFRAKTTKIVNAMLTIDADIYAFCEVEAKPIVLAQLADSMSAHAGAPGRYAAVVDNIDYTFDDGYDNHLKSGFIYRTDKVDTYGNSSAATGAQYYKNTMRIQAFKQLSNNEKLVVSMNHFKAKDSSADQGESTRQNNADNLVNALKKISTDPDILVLGDLNCEYGEAPITTIVNAGFEEQLLRFNSNAYSHCYGGGELIDHVLANATMRTQIANAYVKHICTYKCTTGVSSSTSYSDHDPYIIEINLGGKSPEALETTVEEPQAIKILRDGQLIIIRGGVEYTITGVRLQ